MSLAGPATAISGSTRPSPIISRCFLPTSQKNPDQTLHAWLVRYRKGLLTKPANEDLPPAATGALIMGMRLVSSKSPTAYDQVFYGKGAWIMHMLREMLRQPNTPNPDARFMALLKSLVSKYAQKSLTTVQFQREVEAVMTPKMDLEGGRSMEWFSTNYVRGTAIPRYKVSFPRTALTRAIKCAASCSPRARPTRSLRLFLFSSAPAPATAFPRYGNRHRRRDTFFLYHPDPIPQTPH